MDWDVFIAHAGEDKSVARPLAELLSEAGLLVWLDEWELRLGDSLREKIDEGLARSRFGVVVLSHSFFGKHWPKKELDGLASREVGGVNVILPVWNGVDQPTITKYSPILADRVGVSISKGLEHVIREILRVVRPGDDSRPLSGTRGEPELLAPDNPLNLLTAREREIAFLIGSGATHREIASRLRVGENTVEAHLAAIIRKLGFSVRPQLVQFLANQNWSVKG